FRAFRDPTVECDAPQGVARPVEHRAFTVPVSAHARDHVEDPARVLAQVRRGREPGGAVWVRVHVYHGWGRLVRQALERFEVDRGHPRAFTPAALRALAEAAGFAVLHEARGRYGPAWWGELTAGSAKRLAHALLLVTRVEATLVLRRP